MRRHDKSVANLHLASLSRDLVEIVKSMISPPEDSPVESAVGLRIRALQLAIQARGAVPSSELFATAEEFERWLLQPFADAEAAADLVGQDSA